MPPLRGLIVSYFFLHKCRPYGAGSLHIRLLMDFTNAEEIRRNTLSKTPYRAWLYGVDAFYTDAVRPGLKRISLHTRFASKVRFGCKPNLPDLGPRVFIFSKIDTYGAVRKPHLPELGGEDSIEKWRIEWL